MQWSEEAREILEAMMMELPLPVRDGVRQVAELRAETVCAEAGVEPVTLEAAVRAFIEATPSDLRQRLKHSLSYHGIDPEDYDAAFDA